MTHPALNEIHQGFVAGLKEYGYTPGKNIKIDFQNAQGDQSNLKTMSTKFVNENVSLMAGIATPAAQALANVAGKKTPVILAGITNPSGSGLVKTDKHPGANITGTSGESPLQKQLALLKKYCLMLKKLELFILHLIMVVLTMPKNLLHFASKKVLLTNYIQYLEPMTCNKSHNKWSHKLMQSTLLRIMKLQQL